MKVFIKASSTIEEVKTGYALNYLIPRGLAVPATPAVLSKLTKQKEVQETKFQEKQRLAEEQAKQLNGKKITIHHHSNEDGDLFGSIGQSQIKKALNIKEKSSIQLSEPIKHTGSYQLKGKVGKHPFTVTVEVSAS